MAAARPGVTLTAGSAPRHLVSALRRPPRVSATRLRPPSNRHTVSQVCRPREPRPPSPPRTTGVGSAGHQRPVAAAYPDQLPPVRSRSSARASCLPGPRDPGVGAGRAFRPPPSSPALRCAPAPRARRTPTTSGSPRQVAVHHPVRATSSGESRPSRRTEQFVRVSYASGSTCTAVPVHRAGVHRSRSVRVPSISGTPRCPSFNASRTRSSASSRSHVSATGGPPPHGLRTRCARTTRPAPAVLAGR